MLKLIEIVLILHISGTGQWVEHDTYPVMSDCIKAGQQIRRDEPKTEWFCVPREVEGNSA